MKHFKKILTALLVISMLVPMVLTAWPTALAAEDPFSQWKTDGWTQKEEDGTPILVGKDNATMNLLYLDGNATRNTLKFDIRMDTSYGTEDGCIGAAFKMANGDQYFFEYNTIDEIIRVRRLGSDGSDKKVCPEKAYQLEMKQWYTFEIACDEGLIRWSIDGDVVLESADTGNDSFENMTAYIQGYYVCPSLRNIYIESEKTPAMEAKKLDLEFTTAQSVESFSATNGVVSWEDDKLIYTLSGANTRLTSPVISAEPGTAYSACLPLRNTILVRMKNQTSASSVRVWYTTTTSKDYNEAHSATFDVEPQSDFTTYFFNLSACPDLSGYLTGFAIEPIGATSGTMEIEAITFEREKAFYDYAGTIDSCTTDGETITIKGTVNPEYAGKTVKLYETMPENYTEDLIDSEVIAEVQADKVWFTITVPHMNGNVSRLSSFFLVGVEGKRLSDRFQVENYEDFSENPYAFDLPDYTVKVTDAPFSAKGDAFTNDNAAIQAAIDHVSAQGGGTVIVPGDDSFYGRRYVATNIQIKDNVELRIEEGAVIWQSPRASDYDYEIAFGHDIAIPGVNWTHAASCHNMPLIQGDHAKNIKLTGGGIIRSMDLGSECADGVSSSTLWTGCENKIHLVPVGFFACENVEISNINLRRTNNYHVNLRTCQNIYVANVSMFEVTCASGDGISATVGTKNIIIDRCSIFSNDDAITICSTYNDPRGLAWWHANPEGDNCIDNLIVRHCNLNSGHGVTFITWGTDNPDLSKQEIKNIEIYDNILDGGSSAVGTWPDNPYFGRPFDNTETDDYSPVKNVRMYNNRYRAQTTLQCIQGTNIITDNSIRSAADFQYGDFERGLQNYPNFVTGLSNWTELPTEGKTGSVSVGTDGKNHYGIIQGTDTLVQGLWMSRGEHTFTIDTRMTAGQASLIVQDVLTGELLAEKAVQASDGFVTNTLTFTLEKGTTAYLGIRYEGGADGTLWMDNASVTTEKFISDIYFTETFDDVDALQLTNEGFHIFSEGENAIAAVPEGVTGVLKLTAEHTYEEFDLRFRFRYDACLSDVDANLGISLLRGNGGNDQYDLHYNPLEHELVVRRYQNGKARDVFRQSGFDLPAGEWGEMAVRVQNGKGVWYLNGELLAEFDVRNVTSGQIALAAYNITCAFDDVQIAPAGTMELSDDDVSTETETDPETNPETTPETDPVPPSDTTGETESTDTDGTTECTSEGETDAATEPTAGTDGSTDGATDPADDDGGCASALGMSAVLVMAAVAAVVAMPHKKD